MKRTGGILVCVVTLERTKSSTRFSPSSGLQHKIYIETESKKHWAGEMAQQEKGLVTKPADMSLNPSTHMVEGETNYDLHMLSYRRG